MSYGSWPLYKPITWEPSDSSAKKKHKYKSILLLNSTVYDCIYCGVKREEATSEYCEEEDDDDWGSTGGW